MYEIIWKQIAKAELRTIFLNAANPAEIAETLSALQSRLRETPLLAGFSRGSSVHRMDFELPLLVEYYVIEDDKRVEVLSVLDYHGS
jgi:hypothetical protein